MPTTLEPDAPPDGEDGATRVLNAEEARNPRIPFRKEKYAPAGPDPN